VTEFGRAIKTPLSTNRRLCHGLKLIVTNTDAKRVKQRVDYRDATDDPDQRVAYPEVVAGFVDLGFKQVGRLAAEPIGGIESLIAGYDREDARRFLEMAPIPTPVLTSPDATAFVEVSWFWESPSIRIRSLLEDGSLVETLRLWDHPPGLPRLLQTPWQDMDLYREMTRASTPDGGRSIQVVPDAGPSEMWQAHQRHLGWLSGRRGSGPIRHDSMEQVISLTRMAFEHDYRLASRARNLMLAGLALYSLAAAIVVFPIGRSYGLVPCIAAGGAALLGYYLLARWAVTRLHRLPESLRPAFSR
jgi:hypothetical protein